VLLSEIVKLIDGKKLWDFENRDCKIAGASDMLSELLALAKENMVLITGLCTPQMVKTADIVGVGAIIVVRGRQVPEVTVQTAKDMKIPIVSTSLTMYTTCGKLFCAGLEDVHGIRK